MSAPTRPVLRYMGGKWRLAPWIVRHFPEHQTYVEPFGGAASVLLRKPRSYAEIYNDLDGEVVNLFRILRDPVQSRELARLVGLTPFAREEFELTYLTSGEPLEDARRLVARSFMGHGSTAGALRRRTGFRADSNRSGTTPAHDWAQLAPALLEAAERLAGVVIENRPALPLIACFDAPSTLFYCDPPYLHETRSRKRVKGALAHAYVHEMSVADHEALLELLLGVEGMVAISGYRSELYDDRLAGWERLELDTYAADGARPRVEHLWLNPACAQRHGLFAEAEARRA